MNSLVPISKPSLASRIWGELQKLRYDYVEPSQMEYQKARPIEANGIYISGNTGCTIIIQRGPVCDASSGLK